MDENRLITIFENGLRSLSEQIDTRFALVEARFAQVDARFAQIEAQIDTRFAQVEARFEQVEARFAQVEARFAQIEAQIDTRFEQVDARFERIEARLERVEVEVRHAHVAIEGLRGEIRQVAEGVLTVDEKLERHIVENERQFDDVRAMMRLSYVQLEQRVGAIEQRETG